MWCTSKTGERRRELGWTGTLLNLDAENGFLPIVDSSSAVSATGVSAEYKYFKSEDAKVDLKAYLGVSSLGTESTSGMGYSVGTLARLNFGSGDSTTAMRLRRGADVRCGVCPELL